MKIILNKDQANLGEEGDVCEVARGYARNFLIPRGIGVPHTKQNVAALESRRAAIEKRKEEKRTAALGLKEKIEALTITVEMASGENGKLFGSVGAATILEELNKQGIQVERKKIELAEHLIKSIGNHVAKVKLYGSEVANLKISVVGASKKEPTAPPEARSPEPAPAPAQAEGADSAS